MLKIITAISETVPTGNTSRKFTMPPNWWPVSLWVYPEDPSTLPDVHVNAIGPGEDSWTGVPFINVNTVSTAVGDTLWDFYILVTDEGPVTYETYGGV